MAGLLYYSWSVSFILLAHTACTAYASTCTLYIAPSLIPGAGKGIYAGKPLVEGSPVGLSHTVIVDDYITEELRLMNYVFTTHYNFYGAVLLGPALMLNHRPERSSNLDRVWIPGIVPALSTTALRPYTTYSNIAFRVRRPVAPGEELTFSYGDDDYFEERNVATDFSNENIARELTYSPEELSRVGHCLTDVFVNSSTIPMAGKGVFTTRPRKIGDLVSVSAVLVVPKHVVARAGRGSVLLNYIFSSNETDIALLPTGTAGMINHGGRKANVEVRWFDWEGVSTLEKLGSMDVEKDLIGAQSAPLYFGYYATRPIAPGEELLLSYGSEWETAWESYVGVMSSWLEKFGDEDMLSAPQFRQPVNIPSTMLPQEWMGVKCVGSRDCREPFSARQIGVFNSQLNSATSHELSVTSFSPKVCENRLDSESAVDNQNVERDYGVCGLYLAPLRSNAGSGFAGVGVFAGSSIKSGSTVDNSQTVLFQHIHLVKNPQLRRVIAYAVHRNHAVATLGVGSAFRSSPHPNTDKTFNSKDTLVDVPYPQTQGLRPYTLNTEMLYYATKDIHPGEELTTLQSFDPDILNGNPKPYTLEELSRVGHCLTDVFVNSSTIPMAGKGVFTTRPRKIGDLVSVSAVLVVPKHIIVEDGSVLLNYIFSSNETDIALLPTGTAGMINHGGRKANVEVRWFDWEGVSTLEKLGSMDIEKDLIGAQSAPLYFGYYATRPIAPGEELLLSYGSEWETAWESYVGVMSSWLEKFGDEDMLSAPQFRQHIDIPSSMFVQSFRSRNVRLCAGQMDCKGISNLSRPPYKLKELNKFTNTKLAIDAITTWFTWKDDDKDVFFHRVYDSILKLFRFVGVY